MTLREEIVKNSGFKNKVYTVFNDDFGDVITVSGKQALFPTQEEALEKTLKLCKDYYNADCDKEQNIEFKLCHSSGNETRYNILVNKKYNHTDVIITGRESTKKPNSNQKLMFEIEV